MQLSLIVLKKYSIHIFLFFTVFISSFCQAQWIQQTVPVSGGPYDMVFFDANTGILSNSSPALFRTTNGGQNWVVHKDHWQVGPMQKIDSTTVYMIGRYLHSIGGDVKIYRTYDKGLTWDSVYESSVYSYYSLSFVNLNTGWVSCFDGYANGFISKTTNGGINFTILTNSVGFGQLYMYREQVFGNYIGWHSGGVGTTKTTDGGVTWTLITSAVGIGCTYFLNKDTGWTTSASCMYKTFDGGYNWTLQPMPSDPSLTVNGINSFFVVSKDIIYGIGGEKYLGGSSYRGVIWKTTNGGINWGYQLPNVGIGICRTIFFSDSLTGWAFNNGTLGIYTNSGGGPIIYTKINNNTQNISRDYKLYQNYPNPFNPVTSIRYKVESTKQVKLIIFSILGKEITTLVNQKQKAGEYEVSFNGANLPSEVYYYVLYADGVRVDAKKMVLIK